MDRVVNMGKMTTWWSSLRFGRPVQHAEDDYADMGTAFGLDASMVDTVPSAYIPLSSGHPEAQTLPFEHSGASSRF